MGHLNRSGIKITGRPGKRVQFQLNIQAVQGSILDQDAVYPDRNYRGIATVPAGKHDDSRVTII